MIVVDSSALVAIIKGEAEGAGFAASLAKSGGCLVSAVSLMETSFVIAGRQKGAAAWRSLDLLVADMEIVAFDVALALLARDAFVRYGKGRHPAGLNMGDCASYALAKSRGLKLLFKGDDFARTDIVAA